MYALLCRNRVEDFRRWKTVFDSHAGAHRAAGLHLQSIWRGLEHPDNVFFVFEVTDIDKARAYLNAPQAAQAGRNSGVLDGEDHFLEASGGY